MQSICVLGLGYIGLPTASVLATHGHQVLGVDVNPSVVDVVNQGKIHIEEPGLNTVVQAATRSGHLKAALAPQPADVFIIAVPTPCVPNGEHTFGADMRAVRSATEALCEVVKEGDLVILESTSPPGTTADIVAATIQARTGLVAGQGVFVAHCPERVLPGRILHELIDNDRVIGGVTPACAERASRLYAGFITGKCFQTDATTAEMVKLMENTYRDVNIALANELALIAEELGFDANEVITLANRHPRVHLHRPGPGVGGHCISVDPWFVHEAAPAQARLIKLARDINHGRPEQVVETLRQRMGSLGGRRVAVFGVAYKGNVDDVRESPSTDIIRLLKAHDAQVTIYDPHVHQYEYDLSGLREALDGAEVLLMTTGHDEFAFLEPNTVAERMASPVVYDLVAILNEARWTEAGFTFWKVGRRVNPGS